MPVTFVTSPLEYASRHLKLTVSQTGYLNGGPHHPHVHINYSPSQSMSTSSFKVLTQSPRSYPQFSFLKTFEILILLLQSILRIKPLLVSLMLPPGTSHSLLHIVSQLPQEGVSVPSLSLLRLHTRSQ
jgi:hypothetical protein